MWVWVCVCVFFPLLPLKIKSFIIIPGFRPGTGPLCFSAVHNALLPLPFPLRALSVLSLNGYSLPVLSHSPHTRKYTRRYTVSCRRSLAPPGYHPCSFCSQRRNFFGILFSFGPGRKKRKILRKKKWKFFLDFFSSGKCLVLCFFSRYSVWVEMDWWGVFSRCFFLCRVWEVRAAEWVESFFRTPSSFFVGVWDFFSGAARDTEPLVLLSPVYLVYTPQQSSFTPLLSRLCIAGSSALKFCIWFWSSLTFFFLFSSFIPLGVGCVYARFKYALFFSLSLQDNDMAYSSINIPLILGWIFWGTALPARSSYWTFAKTQKFKFYSTTIDWRQTYNAIESRNKMGNLNGHA